jgi:hypothetical protein
MVRERSVRSWRVFWFATVVVFGLSSVAPALSQSRIRVLQPPLSVRSESDGVFAVAGVGDVSGDGFPDFLYRYTVSLSPSLNGIALVSGKEGRTFRFYSALQSPGGGAIAGLRDVDGDGVLDYALASPYDDVSVSSQVLVDAGRIFVYSGKTGARLLTVDGWGAKQRLGDDFLRGIGDIDGDGVPDFAATYTQQYKRRLALFSGRSGGILVDSSGFRVCGVGDLDGDGADEYVIGYPGDSTVTTGAGAARLHSGKTGKVIRSWYGNGYGTGLGWRVASCGDLDQDGKGDFLVTGARHASSTVWRTGYVQAISSRGPVLWEWRGLGYHPDYFGWNIGAANADGDGIPDIFISAGGDLTPERVRVYSGRTGKKLLFIDRLEGTRDNMPTDVIANVGDTNGDGFDDLAFAQTGNGHGLSADGLHVAGLNFESITPDKSSVSLSKQEALRMSLCAGPLHLGQFYIVLGGLSAANRGTQLEGFHLPIQWDAYTTLTLAYPNGALYKNSFGVLAQAGGRASCEFKLASWLPPELIGLSFVHSFAVLDTQSAELRFVGGVVHTKVTP